MRARRRHDRPFIANLHRYCRSYNECSRCHAGSKPDRSNPNAIQPNVDIRICCRKRALERIPNKWDRDTGSIYLFRRISLSNGWIQLSGECSNLAVWSGHRPCLPRPKSRIAHLVRFVVRTLSEDPCRAPLSTQSPIPNVG